MTPFKSALCSHQSQKGSHTTPDATFVQQARKARPRREVPAEQRPGLGPWASLHCPAGGGGAREERHCVRRRDGRRVLKTGQAEPWFPSLLHLHAGFCPLICPSLFCFIGVSASTPQTPSLSLALYMATLQRSVSFSPLPAFFRERIT